MTVAAATMTSALYAAVDAVRRGLFAPPVEQPLAAPTQFVGDQTRDQIDRRHRLGLGLAQSGFQHGGDAAEPELS